MPWFKVDDNLAFHAKVIAAGNAAMGLWVRAGSWSAQQLTDGHIPAHMIASLGKPAEAKRLVDVRLWHEVEGGYEFHQWTDEGRRQPTREEVETKRAEDRERKAAARAEGARKAAELRAASNGSPPGQTEDSEGNPSGVRPTRPDPTRPKELKNTPRAPRSVRADDPDFAAFWSVYPKRVDKGHALKAWTKAIKEAEPADILRGAKVYADQIEASGETRFIPHPSTWLNGTRWTDEPEEKPAGQWNRDPRVIEGM